MSVCLFPGTIPSYLPKPDLASGHLKKQNDWLSPSEVTVVTVVEVDDSIASQYLGQEGQILSESESILIKALEGPYKSNEKEQRPAYAPLSQHTPTNVSALDECDEVNYISPQSDAAEHNQVYIFIS